MRVLLLHPEDQLPVERKRWDWLSISAARRSPPMEMEQGGGGRVISLYDFSNGFEDGHRIRKLLQLGMGRWVDSLGNRLVGRALADDRARPSPTDADPAAGAGTRSRLRASCQPLRAAGQGAADVDPGRTSAVGKRRWSGHKMGAALSGCYSPGWTRRRSARFFRTSSIANTWCGDDSRATGESQETRLCCCHRHTSMFRGRRASYAATVTEPEVSDGLCPEQRPSENFAVEC